MHRQRFRISHRTTYEYSRPMNDGYTVAFVVPRPTPEQRVERIDVVVEPEPDERIERDDLFGNRVVQLGIHHQHDSLSVTATSEVSVAERTLDGDGPAWDDVAAAVVASRGRTAIDVRPFAGGVPLVSDDSDRELLHELAVPAFMSGRPVVDAARTLCHRIHEQFEYDHAFTEVSTPLSAVLSARRGVCQDFAHLAVSALRMFGLATRYVSGYIETSPRGGEPALTGADASHAWCSVWVPGLGWVDFDPTNDQLPVQRHITVAWGRDYGDVAPVRGVVIGPPATQHLTVAVGVTRV
jgi:transglutaminase-like putative cysteine protease